MRNFWRRMLALTLALLIPITLGAVVRYGSNGRTNGHYQENGDWVDTERGEQSWDVEEPYAN